MNTTLVRFVYAIRYNYQNLRRLAREFVRGREPLDPPQRPNDVTGRRVLGQVDDTWMAFRRVGGRTAHEVLVVDEYRVTTLGGVGPEHRVVGPPDFEFAVREDPFGLELRHERVDQLPVNVLITQHHHTVSSHSRRSVIIAWTAPRRVATPLAGPRVR